jgi:hypothetical protein
MSEAMDRHLIVEALARYAWGYDEGDFELLADSFTADARSGGTVAHTDLGWGPMNGREQIVEVLAGIRKSQADQRRHSIHTVRFHAQTATQAEFSCYMHITGAEDGAVRLVTSGWYRALVVKEPDGTWRMRNLTARLDAPF